MIENRIRKYLLYSVGEIILIMVGILLATQVREWNQTKRDRIEERILLTRLSDELKINTEKISYLLEGFEKRDVALEKVLSAFKGNPIVSDSVFLSDVIIGSLWGWTVQPLQRHIYDEANNTGKLVIVQNEELRTSITVLYNAIEVLEGTGLSRSSDYAQIVYGLLPRESESELMYGLSSIEMKVLVEQVLNSELYQHIIFEQNRSIHLKWIWSFIDEEIAKVNADIAVELNK